MTNPSSLNAVHHPPLTGRLPDSLVILLHGLGADGQDLISLAPELAAAAPSAAFVAPDAPWPCDMAPFGYQWFSLQDRDAGRVYAGVQTAFGILQGFLDTMADRYGVPGNRTVLAGFSQGAMMALHAGLRQQKGCAGVVAWSGALTGPEHLATETVSRPPVLVIHGAEDEIVPPQVFEPAVRALEGAGVPVEGHMLPGLGHGIDPRGLDLARNFLARTLPPLSL
ncbi:MAG: prolyl oligopeptidase family serine peptidase [Pseudomonadota bacterium]|nr:prolyl oligopeptidase family serine peptidase [Pseudomonadota bacterium]